MKKVILHYYVYVHIQTTSEFFLFFPDKNESNNILCFSRGVLSLYIAIPNEIVSGIAL